MFQRLFSWCTHFEPHVTRQKSRPFRICVKFLIHCCLRHYCSWLETARGVVWYLNAGRASLTLFPTGYDRVRIISPPHTESFECRVSHGSEGAHKTAWGNLQALTVRLIPFNLRHLPVPSFFIMAVQLSAQCILVLGPILTLFPPYRAISTRAKPYVISERLLHLRSIPSDSENFEITSIQLLCWWATAIISMISPPQSGQHLIAMSFLSKSNPHQDLIYPNAYYEIRLMKHSNNQKLSLQSRHVVARHEDRSRLRV